MKNVKKKLKNVKNKLKTYIICKEERGAWEESFDSLRLLKLAHSLEKGMGLPNARYGYGISKAKELLAGLQNEASSGKNQDRFAFLEALHVLKAYILFQQKENVELGEIPAKAEELIAGLSESEVQRYKELQCGYVVNKEITVVIDAYHFFKSRHSVRDFDFNKMITKEKIDKAVEIASLAPSACNRQPSKVYYTLNHQRAEEVGKIIPGNKGFEDTIPYFAVITVDRSLFEGPELFQWYVNGGIFLAYFVNGLHSVGISSCIFQIPFGNQAGMNTKIKELIGASDTEVVCAVVGFGKAQAEYKILCAQRRNIEEVSRKF